MYVEVNNRCRLCACIMQNLKSIESVLIKRIRLLFQLKIERDEGDNFPKKICFNCFDSVNTSWSFFERITKAQRDLYKICLNSEIDLDLNWSENTKVLTNNEEEVGEENTVIFNEISIIPIEISVLSNRNKDNACKVDEDDKVPDRFRCSPVQSLNDSEEISTYLASPILLRYTSSSSESSNDSETSENSYETETSIPASPPKRKRKLKSTSTSYNNNQLIRGKIKKANLVKSKASLKKTASKRNIKTVKKAQIQSVDKKNVINEYQLDPSDVWPDYPWSCNVCSAKCADIDDYKNHPCFQIHKRFFCTDCPKTLVRPEQFFQHVAEVHWERMYKHLSLQCDECRRWFRTMEAQEDHRSAEHPNAPPRLPLPETPHKHPYQCDQCGKNCKTRSLLTNHQRLHAKDKPHTCDICGKAYFYPSALLEHKKLHNKSRDFICEQCGRGFYNKGTLKSHKQTHLDVNERELPFACSFCGKGFANRCKLRYHEMVHTGAKPFVCDICGRNFRLRDSLKGHVTIVHSDEKTHSCSCCDMKFKTATNLSAHMRQHTGEHPYACTECSKTFSNYSNCDKHMKRIHNLTLKGRVNLAKICANLRKETEDV